MAQNESTKTTIISRIMSKIDTAANWDTNNPVLLKGEVVPVIVPDSEGNTAYVAFKVGDGVSNYTTLPFTSANAWDVYDWAKAETKPTYDYSEIKNTPTIPSAQTVDQKYSATSKNAQSGVAVAEALALKVDKVDGKTLTSNDFTSALLSKLNGIAEGANKYVHPTHTAHTTSSLYKITVDALGHVSSATAVTKADITGLGIPAITVDDAMSTTSTNPVQNKVVNTALSNKQDKFADVTNPGICKVTMSNSGQTYFCNGASDSGIYFDSSIRLLQGKGIKNDDDLVHKKYVDTEVANNKVTVDSEMSDTSTNPVQNKVVKAEIDSKALNVTDTGSGNLSISSLGYSPVTTNSVYISDFTDTSTTNVDSDESVTTQSVNSSSQISTQVTPNAGSEIVLKSIYFKDLDNTYIIPDAVTVDTALSSSSKNPVQNQVINTALAGKTDLTASGASSLINKLSTGADTPSDADYFVSQYAGGGTTNTNYYRRPVSTLNTYIKNKADKTPTSGSTNLVTSGAVYTALAGKASSSHTHTLNQVNAGTFNTTGAVDYISRSLVPSISGTKMYGMPAAAITVEYSRDGGTTWVDYGLNAAEKMRIFNHSIGASLYLGKASAKADNSLNNMLRITIDASKGDGRYISIDSMYTWMTTNGNTTFVTLEVAPYKAPTTFGTVVNSAQLSGWSGPNISHFGTTVFGGSSAGSTSPNNQIIRLTYKQTAINSNYPSAQIADVRFFGLNVWGAGSGVSNSMLKNSAPYAFDVNADGSTGNIRFSSLAVGVGTGSPEGKWSLAGGESSRTSNDYTIAFGTGLRTALANQAVFGKYNAISSTALFQVGNGTSTSDYKTAFNVFTDGHAEVQTQGTTNNSVVIKSELDKKQNIITSDTSLTVATVNASKLASTNGIDVGNTSGTYSNLTPNYIGFFTGASAPEAYMYPTAHSGTTPAKMTIASPNQYSDVGHMNVTLTGLANGTSNNDAVNVSQLNSKQDLIGTITGNDVQTLTSSQKGLIVKFTDTPQASQTFSNYYAFTSDKLSTDKLIFGLGSSGVYPVGVEGGRDNDGVYIAFSNPGGLAVGLRNILTPVNDTDAANKQYVTTAVSNKLDADTDNYNIAYDTTSEAIKITFKN